MQYASIRNSFGGGAKKLDPAEVDSSRWLNKYTAHLFTSSRKTAYGPMTHWSKEEENQ